MNSKKTSSNTPQHVAIIMDGNGRWANERNLPRIEGHRRGADAVKRTLAAAQKHGVKNITLYAFSVENWNRPKDEVEALMNLLDRFLKDQLPELIKRKIRLRVVGRFKELPASTQAALRNAEAATQHFTEYTLGLALNYGSRTEIVDAVKAVVKASENEEVDMGNFHYDDLRPFLYTQNMPDPDLVIRTSGELRLSNFLMLQCAYAEIHITKTRWPDFKEEDFAAALEDFAARERRYGQTSQQLHKA